MGLLNEAYNVNLPMYGEEYDVQITLLTNHFIIKRDILHDITGCPLKEGTRWATHTDRDRDHRFATLISAIVLSTPNIGFPRLPDITYWCIKEVIHECFPEVHDAFDHVSDLVSFGISRRNRYGHVNNEWVDLPYVTPFIRHKGCRKTCLMKVKRLDEYINKCYE